MSAFQDGVLAHLRPAPSWLCFLVLLPGLVSNVVKTENGPVPFRSDGDDMSLATGCLALFTGYVGSAVALVYAAFPGWFEFGQLTPQQPVTVVTGGLVAAGGVAVTCWARLVLAGNWVGGPYLRTRHQLVTSGPYRLVRHPMYSGFACFHLGLFTATGNIVPLLGDGSFRALLLWQALGEERLLVQRFGPEYTLYERRTGRFLPRVRKGLRN